MPHCIDTCSPGVHVNASNDIPFYRSYRNSSPHVCVLLFYHENWHTSPTADFLCVYVCVAVQGQGYDEDSQVVIRAGYVISAAGVGGSGGGGVTHSPAGCYGDVIS